MNAEIAARAAAQEEKRKLIRQSYDEAFRFLKEASQGNHLSREEKAALTIRGCYGFLKAYDLESSSRSKNLILTEVCNSLNEVNLLYNRAGIFPMPQAKSDEERKSGLYLLRLGTYYYSQGIEAETVT